MVDDHALGELHVCGVVDDVLAGRPAGRGGLRGTVRAAAVRGLCGVVPSADAQGEEGGEGAGGHDEALGGRSVHFPRLRAAG